MMVARPDQPLPELSPLEPFQARPATFLPPAQARQDSLTTLVRPVTTPTVPTSTVHFLVHPGMPEIAQYAQERGWLAAGWTTLSIEWLEMHYTTDGWQTSHVLSSSDVPCPVVNGHFYLPNVGKGTELEFALHAGVGCHAPQDTAYVRDTGALWFNNAGHNFRQISK